MTKAPDAFRTISEVSELLDTPAHVLRFWESKFPQVRPVKRAGGRRYYRPGDLALLSGIKRLLHEDGLTIRGVQKILREQGVGHVAGLGPEAVRAGVGDEPAQGGAVDPAGAPSDGSVPVTGESDGAPQEATPEAAVASAAGAPPPDAAPEPEPDETVAGPMHPAMEPAPEPAPEPAGGRAAAAAASPPDRPAAPAGPRQEAGSTPLLPGLDEGARAQLSPASPPASAAGDDPSGPSTAGPRAPQTATDDETTQGAGPGVRDAMAEDTAPRGSAAAPHDPPAPAPDAAPAPDRATADPQAAADAANASQTTDDSAGEASIAAETAREDRAMTKALAGRAPTDDTAPPHPPADSGGAVRLASALRRNRAPVPPDQAAALALLESRLSRLHARLAQADDSAQV